MCACVYVCVCLCVCNNIPCTLRILYAINLTEKTVTSGANHLVENSRGRIYGGGG